MNMTTATKTIRSGYKQTEVGVIPEDWGVSKVGKEFEIQLGKMLDAVKNIGVPKSYLGNKAVQWNHIDISLQMPSRKLCKREVGKEPLQSRYYRHRLFLWKRLSL